MTGPRTRQEKASAAQAESQGVKIRAKRSGGLIDDRTHKGYKPRRHESWKRNRSNQYKS